MIGANAWAVLALAGLFEIFWAIGLKYSQGFTKVVPTVLTICGALASFWLLSRAMLTLPVGTAYAVWVGIGAVGAAILGMALFSEPVSVLRLVGIALIVAGIAALRFS